MGIRGCNENPKTLFTSWAYMYIVYLHIYVFVRVCLCMYAKEIERNTMIFGEIIFLSFCVFVCLYLSVCVYVCKEDCAQE